ncbi:MAG: hypothetical protein ACFFBD_23530 [Candidatus Hodarchaeota archaeon]
MEDRIRETAEQVIRIIREDLGIALEYDEESVAWVDGYIERIKERSSDQESFENLIGAFGAYLGECIRHQFGGQWEEIDGQWAIVFIEGKKHVEVFPFGKVEKQFHSNYDSILEFFTATSTFLNLWGISTPNR